MCFFLHQIMTHLTLGQILKCGSDRLAVLEDLTEDSEDPVQDLDLLLGKMKLFACIICKAAARG